MADTYTDVATPRRPRKGSPAQQRDAGVIRARKALELRAIGLTYSQVAEECGYTHASAARKAVERALADSPPSAAREQLRQLETAHLLQLRRVALQRLSTMRTRTVRRGREVETTTELDPAASTALTTLVKISDRIAKLHGLDAPTTVRVTTELDEEIDGLLEQLGSLPPAPVEVTA